MMKRSKQLEARQQQAIEEKSGLLKNVESVDDLTMFPFDFHSDLYVKAEEVYITYSGNVKTSPITLEIHRGDRIVLDGKNGSGKSSFLHLILQEHMLPEKEDEDVQKVNYAGNLFIPKGLKISYVSQKTDRLSGTLSDYAAKQKIDETLYFTLLRKLGFERIMFTKNMEDFSEGQKKKVLIAKSLCEQAHLYIWDEPLNYLDIYTRSQLEDVILKTNPTMLFVEHDEMFREKIASKTIILE